MHARAVLLALLVSLAGAAPAQARKGEPLGVYSGAIHITKDAGVRCLTQCRLRIVLSDDGREITKASRLTGKLSRSEQCSDSFAFDEQPYRYATIRAGGRFNAYYDNGRGAAVDFAAGHFKGRVMVGHGELGCDTTDAAGAFTFRLGLTGHAPRSTECDREATLTTMVLVRQRRVGCHAAHVAARNPTACGPLATPTLGEPAATLACGKDIELVPLRNCAGGSVNLYATPAVPCEEANALGFPPDQNIGAGDRGAFRCVPADDATADFNVYYSVRCDDPKDPRRVLVVTGVDFFD